MERRSFLKIAAGTLAAAGISNILRAQGSEEIPLKVFFSDSANQLNYSLSYYSTAITHLGSADAKKRTATLEISKTNATGQKTSGTYEFEITSSVQDAKMTYLYDLKGRSLKHISGSETLPRDFPRILTLLVYQSAYPSSNYFRFLNDNGSIYVELKPAVASDTYEDDYYGCFLTTACVEHRGLPDDCYELETLRAFRDNYMRPTTEGRHLVDEYYKKGPSLVARLNQQANAPALYDYIYDTLVTPAIDMIEQKKYPAAMRYYKDYVLELERQMS